MKPVQMEALPETLDSVRPSGMRIAQSCDPAVRSDLSCTDRQLYQLLVPFFRLTYYPLEYYQHLKDNFLSLVLDIDTPSDMQDRVRVAARARRLALGMTQSDLATRSGVPLATLKRFEQKGQISLAGLLALADALHALSGFGALFPAIEETRLEDIDKFATRQRVRKRKGS
jgi:hypothetical protein